MWLDVEEDDELKGAARIKVTVSEVIEKRGKKKRTRYQCKVILYGASDEEVGGFERFDHPFNDDPRSSSDAKGALKAKAMADFRRQKRTREEREQGDLEDSDGDDGPCFCLLLFIVSMLTSFFLLHVLPRCCLLPPAPRSSKRAARADVMNIGPNAQYPSWQTGTAHSSLSSAAPPAEEGDIVRAVQGLVSILKVAPEHQKAVQPAVDLIRNQVMQIEELRGALADVRAELDFIVGGLGGEELEVITALQDMIYDVLDMADTPGTISWRCCAHNSARPRPTRQCSRHTGRRRQGSAAPRPRNWPRRASSVAWSQPMSRSTASLLASWPSTRSARRGGRRGGSCAGPAPRANRQPTKWARSARRRPR